jgi:IS4 transposase
MATIDKHDSFFVIRSKANFSFVRVSGEKADKAKGILCDQRVKMKGLNSIEKYEKVFRRVKFYDAEQKKSFVFLSNNLTLPATEIALLYKNRWKIELFFKWIKQHLKIKSFWGVSENAVRT